MKASLYTHVIVTDGHRHDDGRGYTGKLRKLHQVRMFRHEIGKECLCQECEAAKQVDTATVGEYA